MEDAPGGGQGGVKLYKADVKMMSRRLEPESPNAESEQNESDHGHCPHHSARPHSVRVVALDPVMGSVREEHHAQNHEDDSADAQNERNDVVRQPFRRKPDFWVVAAQNTTWTLRNEFMIAILF